MKRNSFTVKATAIILAVLGLFALLLVLSKQYRLAIHHSAGVPYLNDNPEVLLTVIVLVGLASIFLLVWMVKLIFERERLLTEAAIEIRKVTNNLHAGVVNYIPEGNCRIVYASRGYYDILAIDRDELHELYQDSLLGFIPPKYHNFFLNVGAIDQNGYAEDVVQMHDKEGKKYWMQVTLSKAVHAGKSTVSAVFVDVSALKATQDKLVRAQDRYRIVTELSNDVMFEYDYKNDVLKLSERFSLVYGRGNVIGSFRKEINSIAKMIHPEDRRDSLEQILRTKRIGANDIQLRLLDANGEYQWCRILYRVVCNEEGIPMRAIGKISNISIFKKEIEELDRASKTDSLTGAYNKMATKEVIDEYIQKHKDGMHMLLMVDVDDFKKVNDNYGHQNGDEVLMYAIRNLRENYKDGEIIGRVGGDEFVVFIGEVTNRELLLEKAQMLRDLLHRPYRKEDLEIPVSASVGVSMYPQDGKCYEELMYCADSALYEVKSSHHKGNFAVYQKKEKGKE